MTEFLIFYYFENNLKSFGKIETVFVDGAFKSYPKLSIQMFTVHGVRNCNYLPRLFFTHPDKEDETYEKSFLHIISKCSKFNIFSPKITFADFEKSINLALLTVWPFINLKGC